MSQAVGAGTSRRGVFLPVGAASVVCVATAYALAGRWVGAIAVIGPGVLLAFHRKTRGEWVPRLFLCGMIAAAAAGAFAGATAYLLVPGAALALAAWDLACFDSFVRRSGSPDALGSLVPRHVRALLRAVGAGLLVAMGGLALSFPIPFWLMLVIVIADLVCLGLALRRLPR
jgi:hypothetical protein